MNAELGISGNFSSAEGPMPLSLILDMDAGSRRRTNQQQKRDRARAFHEKYNSTPPPAQPDQPRPTNPKHYLEHGGPVWRSQKRVKGPH